MQPNSKQEFFLLYTLMALQFIVIVDFMIIMPLSTQVIKEFSVGTSEFGIIVSSYALSASLSALLASSLADKFDRKHALLVCFAGLIAGTLACGLANSFPVLLAARIIAGLFGGVLNAVLLSIVGDVIAPNRRGHAMGIVMLAFSLAAIAGVPLGLWISEHYDWRTPFIFLTVMGAVVWVLCLKVIPNVSTHLNQPVVSFIQSYKQLLSVKNHWWGFASTGFVMFGGFLIIPYIAPAMIENNGLASGDLMYVYLVGGAVTLISRPIIAKMTDTYRHANVFAVISFCSLVPIILITQSTENTLFTNLVIAALFFIFMSGRFIPVSAMVTASCEPQFRGRVMSFNTAVQNFASGIAALVAGVMLVTAENGEILNYNWVGYLSAVVGLLSIYIVRRIKAIS